MTLDSSGTDSIGVKYVKINNNKLGLRSAKLSGTKFGWCEVIFEVVLKQFAFKKSLWSKKLGQNFLSLKNFGCKQMGSQKMLGQKHFGSKKVWLEKFWSKIILCPKYFESKKILGQKEFWFKKIKTPTKSGQEQLNYSWYDKKFSAQILTVQMNQRWTLSLNFGQNRVSNNWDIAERKYFSGWPGGWRNWN